MSGPGGVCVWSGGVSASGPGGGGVVVSGPGGRVYPSMHWGRPPMNRILDTRF